MTGAEYQLCGSIEPNTGHLRHAWKAFPQPNSRVCRSSHASPVAYRVEQYFIVRAIPIGDPFVRLQSKVDRANCTGCVHRPAWPDRSKVRQLSAAVLSRQVIRTNQRRLETLPFDRANGSTAASSCTGTYATITCSGQARIQRRVLMSIPRPEDVPGYSKGCRDMTKFEESCSRVAREPRFTTVPIVSRSVV